MKRRLLFLAFPIITLILEILPYGAVCNFMRPPANEGNPVGHFRELYSYFDLTPFGYANFAPLITAVISCVVFLILVAYCFTGKVRLARGAKNILLVCTLISFGPLLFGISFFSIVGLLISLSLLGEFILLSRVTKDDKTGD